LERNFRNTTISAGYSFIFGGLTNNAAVASRDYVEYKKHPLGYWTSEKGKNMRKFFEEFAKKNKKDPLNLATWYTVTKRAITQTKVFTIRYSCHFSLFHFPPFFFSFVSSYGCILV
jgi:hypothetical protein